MTKNGRNHNVLWLYNTSSSESMLFSGVGDVLGLVQGESDPWSQTFTGTEAV